MEDEKELEILTEGINYMEQALSCFNACDNVTADEFGVLGRMLDEFIDRKEKLEIQVKSYTIEEI